MEGNMNPCDLESTPLSPNLDVEVGENSLTPPTLENCAPSEPPFQCTVCDKVFNVQARLQRHYRVHTGEKPFSCDYCPKMFSVKENLNVHRRIHTKERPYICTICSRAFEHSGKLHRHMRTHTGERPHKCEVCEKTFVQSGQLVIHMRSHTGEKPYRCSYCKKGFTCSKQLKVHVRIHTGEKPYECDVCGKTFGYNHVLKMHKLSHLGEKLYKCTLCEEFFNTRKEFDRHIKGHNREDGSKHGDDDNASPKEIEPHPTSQVQAHSRFIEEASPPVEDHSRSYQASPFTPFQSPLTPPRSPPDSQTRILPSPWLHEHNVDSFYPSAPLGNVQIENTNETQGNNRRPLAFFTTLTGERWACPADMVLRLNTASLTTPNFTERDKIQEELDRRIRREETRKQRENHFTDSVVRVLETCLGSSRLKFLGYPEVCIDEVIIKTLKLLGTHACWEPSLKPMDRMKVNLRLLLEVCVPDPTLWNQFGWKGKSIEDIVSEFLKQC